MIERRRFIGYLGAAAAAAAVTALPACNGERNGRSGRRQPEGGEWEDVRRRFPIDRDWIHLAGLLIATSRTHG